MARRRSKKLLEQDRIRAHIVNLRDLSDNDWTDWEADWLESEASRSNTYVYSEKEHAVLRRLICKGALFKGYGRWSVADLIACAHGYKADYGEEDEVFIDGLWQRQPTALRVRVLKRLVGLARLSTDITSDERVEYVIRQIYDHTLVDACDLFDLNLDDLILHSDDPRPSVGGTMGHPERGGHPFSRQPFHAASTRS